MTLPRDASPPPPRRCLWKSPGSVANDSNATPRGADDDDHGGGETYDSLYRRCASLGRLKQPRTFPRLCSNAVVVVQEFALTSFFLARIGIAMKVGKEGALRGGRFSSHLIQNQQQQLYSDASTAGLYLTLGIVVFYSARADQSQQQHRVTKATQRTADAALLAVWLRFTAAVVQSLTASYSSDTVQILAMFGMLVHLLCCDYSYANGRTAGAAAAAGDDGNAMAFSARRHRRPPFRGGTVSLNAALFATTLLVSRLSSRDSLAFVFVSLAVVFFSFYPVTRHAISVSYPSSVSVANWVITAAVSTSTLFSLMSLGDVLSIFAYLAIWLSLAMVLPGWKYIAQNSKVSLRGPWDIPTAASMQLDYVVPMATKATTSG